MWSQPGLLVERIGTDETADRDAFFAACRRSAIAEVEVEGVAADYYVRWAVEGLLARGFRVVVPPALTRGIVRQIDSVAAEEWSAAPVTLAEVVR